MRQIVRNIFVFLNVLEMGPIDLQSSSKFSKKFEIEERAKKTSPSTRDVEEIRGEGVREGR